MEITLTTYWQAYIYQTTILFIRLAVSFDKISSQNRRDQTGDRLLTYKAGAFVKGQVLLDTYEILESLDHASGILRWSHHR